MKGDFLKAMKTMKKLIPALAMLLVSAVLLGTSTFAWFSMNSQVTATGMKVKAQAEGGIVISNETKTDWKASANASHVISGTTVLATELIPTSTASTTSWFHATSDDANDARKDQEVGNYKEYTLSASDPYKITETDGIGKIQMGNETKSIYLLNKFYIQSSADAVTLGNDGLYINSVTATTTTSNTANLNKALRVAILLNDGANTPVLKIFSPIDGADDSYKVKNTTSIDPINYNVKDTSTGLKNVPAYSATGTGAIEASIYIYFEGEDSNCKSANLASTIDTLDVQVVFGTTKVGS